MAIFNLLGYLSSQVITKNSNRDIPLQMHHTSGVEKTVKFLYVFSSRQMMRRRCISTKPTAIAVASKVGNLLVVASIANALAQPGGTRNLNKKDFESVCLTEDLVLQVLRRNSLDVFKKLDFFRWCSLKYSYKHSALTYAQMFKIMSRAPQYQDEILNLLSSMDSDGVRVDPYTFRLILDGFIRSGKFDSAMEILDHVEKHLGTTTSCLSYELYSSVLVALVHKNHLSTALPIFFKVLESSRANGKNGNGWPDAIVCNELLVGLRKASMKDQFNMVFRKLRENEIFPLDRWGYNICIHAFGCWGDLTTSLSLFKEMKEKSGSFGPDLCTYNSIIQVLCRDGKLSDALKIWDELNTVSVHEPDLFTYRILIQGCSKAYRIADALEIFSQLKHSGICPDTVVYNALLDGLLKARKLTEACSLFEKMVNEDGLRASCWTYNILIDGLFRNGRAEAAYTLFTDLKKKGNNFVDGITFSIVASNLCKEGLIEEALQLVEEMEARGFSVDLVTITSLLVAIYRYGMWELIERLMKHIKGSNLVPNVLKWKAAMETALKAPQSKRKDFTPMFPSRGDFLETLGLLNQDKEKSSLGLAKDGIKSASDDDDNWSSSPYMDMLADQDIPSSLFPLSRAKRVEAKGMDSFDIDMVNTYLSIFLAKGKMSLACKLFEIFSSMGVEPVSYTYNSMMSHFVKKGYFSIAWGVLQAMDENTCPSDIATYNVIIQGLGKLGRADLASAVLDKLMNQGGYLDIVMYNTLINALGKAGRFEEANRLFQQMQSAGISPDVVTYNTLIEVYTKAGRLKDAYKVLKMMLNADCAPNHVTDTTLDSMEKEMEKQRYQKASINNKNTSGVS